ncbi:MAG TPA: ribonuclease HII [Anaerolineales bacterium]|jgi:ribonuclease HII
MSAKPDLAFERALWRGELRHVAGLDEAGRGALAGPVAVGMVLLPVSPRLSRTLSGVRDSKQMTPGQRALWAERIKSVALGWQVGFASSEEIDSFGIVHATRLAALRALECLVVSPDFLLTDFRLELPELDTPQTALVRGDQKSLSIAAASVLAKTARDAILGDLDVTYPGYGLGSHKGYGTAGHRAAIGRLGFSPIHRKTFACKL